MRWAVSMGNVSQSEVSALMRSEDNDDLLAPLTMALPDFRFFKVSAELIRGILNTSNLSNSALTFVGAVPCSTWSPLLPAVSEPFALL